MDYLQATVVTTHEAADAVSELLMRCGAHGTQIIDRSDIPDAQQIADTWALMDESVFDHMPADVWVRAWFSSPTHIENVRAKLLTLPDALAFDAGALTLTVDNVREEDWAESWKQYYKPLRIGKNLVVKPGWEAYQPQPGDKVIELDPGMAFGTGTHETTRLCMELMEQWYEGGDVLDVGTGSGILAVTAALLGAPRVLAVDIDPVAVRVAQENVGINGLMTASRCGRAIWSTTWAAPSGWPAPISGGCDYCADPAGEAAPGSARCLCAPALSWSARTMLHALGVRACAAGGAAPGRVDGAGRAKGRRVT